MPARSCRQTSRREIAVVITLADLIAIRSIPIAQFPDIVPPQVT
jgi:multidrug efflux pump subunit AcrB